MPQIGWFELLLIIGLAVVIIGPKDFPIVLKKIGAWVGSAKRYFNNIQEQVAKLDDDIETDQPVENNEKKTNKDE